MKKQLAAIAAVALLATSSFSALAASAVDADEAQGLQAMGTVSVSSVGGSLDDAALQLANKAKAQGADHYRIIGLDSPGDSSRWSGTAEIYR